MTAGGHKQFTATRLLARDSFVAHLICHQKRNACSVSRSVRTSGDRAKNDLPALLPALRVLLSWTNYLVDLYAGQGVAGPYFAGMGTSNDSYAVHTQPASVPILCRKTAGLADPGVVSNGISGCYGCSPLTLHSFGASLINLCIFGAVGRIQHGLLGNVSQRRR